MDTCLSEIDDDFSKLTCSLAVSRLVASCTMDNSSRLEKCLKYGFVVGSEDMQPYCVVCKKAFSTGSFVPSKMKFHLQRRHPALAESPMTYFRLLYDQIPHHQIISSLLMRPVC